MIRHTFKVHVVEPRDVVDGVAREERVVLHPIDAHEPGPHELHATAQSGRGKILLLVTEPSALGTFKAGALIAVTFEPSTSA